MNHIRHDEDGFLLPKKSQKDIDLILENTEELLHRHHASSVKRVRNASPVIRVNVHTRQRPSSRFSQNLPLSNTQAHSSGSLKKKQQTKTSTLNRKTTFRQPEGMRPNPVQKREQSDRAAQLRQAKIQTELLENIAKNSKQSRGGMMKLLGLGAGVLSGLGKLPVNLMKGLVGGTKANGRDEHGRFLPKGSEKTGGLGIFGKMGKLAKGVFKGGAIGALLGLLGGVDIEQSNMDRADKNKAHAKNAMIGVGGLGGAMAGAAIGSVVPVVGTVIGGILGGFGGAALMDHWVEWLDDRIPKNFSQRMFGSWEGFIGVVKELWGNLSLDAQALWQNFTTEIHMLWQEFSYSAVETWNTFTQNITEWAGALWRDLMPQSVQTFFSQVGDFAKTAWDLFSTGGGLFWDSVKNIAQTAFEHIVNIAQTAFEWVMKPLAEWGSKLLDNGKEWLGKGIDWVSKSALGQAVGGMVKNAGETLSHAGAVIKEAMTGETIQKATQAAQNLGNHIKESVRQTGNRLKNAALSTIGYDMTQKYDDLKYGMGKKSLNGASIDCSGWSFQVSKMEMESLNKMLGFEKYKIKGNQAGILNLNKHGAAEQIGLVSQQYGVVTDSRTGFDRSKLQAGMMIGQMKHSTKYQGRSTDVKGYGKTQYNHIVKVVRNPNGELMISESQGAGKNNGVTLTRLDDWLNMRLKRGDTLTAVNPFGEDIGLLNGNIGTIVKNEANKGANFVFDRVSNGVKMFKEMISSHESRGDYNAYNQGTKGNKTIAADRKYDFAKMTLNDYFAHTQMGFGKGRIFAWGKYQMIPSTTRAAMKAMNLTGQELMTPELQERMFAEYLVKEKAGRGKNDKNSPLYNYIIGAHDNLTEAINASAKEWASIGVAGHVARGKHMISHGNSYYSGEGGNKAYTSPEQASVAINALRTEVDALSKEKGISKAQAYSVLMAGKETVNVSTPSPNLQAAVLPVAPTISAPAASPKPSAPPPMVIHAPSKANEVKSKNTFNPVHTVGNMAHKPVSRTVNHKQIAHMASGGIMDNQG